MGCEDDGLVEERNWGAELTPQLDLETLRGTKVAFFQSEIFDLAYFIFVFRT